MGWFDGASEVSVAIPTKHHHSSSHSHGHSHSQPYFVREKRHHSSGSIYEHGDKHRTRSSPSIFGVGDKHRNRSVSSFFGLGGHHNSSRSSFFGGSSYYRRSPRDGYLRRLYKELKHLIHKLIRYMKKHPIRVFMLVIMPLITGGVLTAMLAKFGLRLPPSVERALGGMNSNRGGISIRRDSYGSYGGGMGGDMAGMVGGALNVAKMFV